MTFGNRLVEHLDGDGVFERFENFSGLNPSLNNSSKVAVGRGKEPET
jgi:hypothetical protein